jgi:hypothetical protein
MSIPIGRPCCQRKHACLELETSTGKGGIFSPVSANFINFINFIKFGKFEQESGRAAGRHEQRRTLPAPVAAGSTQTPSF